jgi:hypothetical protein
MKKIILNNDELILVIKMYEEELLSSNSISERTGISKPTILKILKENGVMLRSSGRKNIGGKKVSDKKYYQQNKEKISQYYSKWRSDKEEHLKMYQKKYREKNIEKIREVKRNYERNRKSTDPIYKLINNFRTAIYQVLKENNVQKNGHYFEVLQYTPDELISHLENQFKDGMTWDNYGDWHVDHILPISIHNIQEIGDDEFMKCWSLDNLQPMWGEDNIKKSNKVLYFSNNP